MFNLKQKEKTKIDEQVSGKVDVQMESDEKMKGDLKVEPIIKVENLRVIYNQGRANEVRSLEDVSVEIYPQEYVIFFGPSGCGKSTLLYSIAGLQAPTYGEIMVEGMNLSQMTRKDKVKLHRTGIGLVFQAFYLIPSLSVLDNVCLPRIFMGVKKKDRVDDGLRLLSRFGISEQAKKFPSQLSGGQKQRVAIARSLVNDPAIILADEPVGNLDSESAKNVLGILKNLNEVDKKTVILVTHNAEHLNFADRVIHIKDGKIIKEEVNREKRPEKAIEKAIERKDENIPEDLRVLMRTFRNLSPQQAGLLMIPFKAKQLMKHVLSELSEEQFTMAENFLKELLFRNIGMETFTNNLDMDMSQGGAGWNKQRAQSFSDRIKDILLQVEDVSGNPEKAHLKLAEYMIKSFDLEVDEKIELRLQSFIKMRLENKIDGFGFEKRLDAPIDLGGVGLYKSTAEKIKREMELLMLLKYSE